MVKSCPGLINCAPVSEDVWVTPPFLTSALDGSGQLHTPAALPPKERTHYRGRLLIPTTGLDVIEKRNICILSPPQSTKIDHEITKHFAVVP
jgi:hypothetical protein